MEKNKCIKASIGVLTYNSGKTLGKCLESLRGFCEIIISDGGSSDNTLQIAKRFGCKIIQQSKLNTPIDDFALERNRMLDAAAYNWFFYLDSDEIMSEELKNEIKRISEESSEKFLVYNVAYYLTNKDTGKILKQYKTYYQSRFFNKKSGARFVKKMHERINIEKLDCKIGKIDSPWYVPLDINLSFKDYQSKVKYRLTRMILEYNSKNFFQFFKKGVIDPLKSILKYLIKIIYCRIKYKKDENIPLRYEMFRIYSQLFIMKIIFIKYLKNIFK